MKYYAFRANIETLDFGRMAYAVINLPIKILNELPEKKTGIRLEGTLNESPFSLAIQHYGENYQIIVSKRLMKEAEVDLGEMVEVEFRLVDKQQVDTPFEILEVIQRDKSFKSKWEDLTAGKKRSLIHPIKQAKRPETKKKRLAELVKNVKSGLT
ncbi:MAG: YdeI/OmpD-associated family protein [Pseudomonadota bacterium]